jgi:hypothetical protein
MSEGHGDIHTIRNILIFFLVLTIISIVLTAATVGYQVYLVQKAKADAEADNPPQGTTVHASALKGA